MNVIVRGDHPILKRPDKVFKNERDADEYVGALIHLGYENVRVEPLVLGELQKSILEDIKKFKSIPKEVRDGVVDRTAKRLEKELDEIGSVQDDRDEINKTAKNIRKDWGYE